MITGDSSQSVGPLTGGTSTGNENIATMLTAAPDGALVVPHGAFLLDADFVRQGPDLLLVGDDGTRVLIKDYFTLSDPPALITEGGAILPPDLVARLAGPLAPGQYAQVAAASQAPPIGQVVTLDGTVTATRADGTQVVLAIDSPVFQGDIVETGAASAIGLLFEDGTTFSLGEDGRMLLDELSYDPDAGSGSLAFSLVQGAFLFVSGEIAASGPDAMTVRTPVATIGIRGTKVAGFAAAEGELNTFMLLEEAPGVFGTIVITTFEGQFTLSAPNQPVQVISAYEQPAAVEFSTLDVDSMFGTIIQFDSQTQLKVQTIEADRADAEAEALADFDTAAGGDVTDDGGSVTPGGSATVAPISVTSGGGDFDSVTIADGGQQPIDNSSGGPTSTPLATPPATFEAATGGTTGGGGGVVDDDDSDPIIGDTVTVAAGSANQAPTPVNDGAFTDEDTAITIDAAGGVLANDTDPDAGDILESDPISLDTELA